MAVDNSRAQCLATGTLGSSFQDFMRQCVTENTNINNVINKNDLTQLLDNEAAKQDDLITSLRGIKDRMGPNSGIQDTVSQIRTLESEIAKLNKQIQENQDSAETENQKFLEAITEAPKETSTLSNLNDVALFVFFISLVILAIVMTIIQYIRPDGSAKKAAFTFLTMSLFILIVYALTKEIA